VFSETESGFDAIAKWAIDDTDNTPIAVLGGYGSGKTSLSQMLAQHFSLNALNDPYARQPILLKLGGFSQYSQIEGLLGAYFTNDFPVPNFNFPNFRHLNSKGRYVIILDGFDEMKHSMSWTDFRSQVQSLLKLHGPTSKIVLLGRPSAFLSESEDRHVLKGERPIGDGWVRIPGWPRFYEFQLKSFTPVERMRFIELYLKFTIPQIPAEQRSARAAVTNSIADGDVDLYSKPVHSKILTDLASDQKFDLQRFESGSSRWVLYDEFIRSIYDREVEKEARSGIDIKGRLAFLCSVAFWLWNEKGSKISFSVDEIPKKLTSEIVGHDDDPIAKIRELLVGSILERKAGDIFFFGHRSFAEFLVAKHMLDSAPLAQDHKEYSNCFTDGVREFLIDSKSIDKTRSWGTSFSAANGRISQSYVSFIARSLGGMQKITDILSPISIWKPIFKPFVSDILPSEVNYSKIMQAIRSSEAVSFAWNYCWLIQYDNEEWLRLVKKEGRGSSSFSETVLVALLNSLFKIAGVSGRTLFIPEKYAGLRRICSDAVRLFEDGDGSSEFQSSHTEIAIACQKELSRAGIAWESEITFDDRPFTVDTSVLYRKLEHSAQNNLLTFVRDVKRWTGITAREDRHLGKKVVSSRKQ
jgi:hypothetical protein